MFQRLDKLMPQSLKRTGAAVPVRAAMILDEVGSVLVARFGQECASAMRPVKFKNGIVTVRCAEAAMTDEIKMREAEVVRAVNDKFGDGTVSGIRAIG